MIVGLKGGRVGLRELKGHVNLEGRIPWRG